MATEADYDDWADETPEPPDRLTELATQLAEYAGLTIGPPLPTDPAVRSVTVQLKCGRCSAAPFIAHLRLDPGVTHEIYDTHLCTGITAGAAPTDMPAVFPFTLSIRGAA